MPAPKQWPSMPSMLIVWQESRDWLSYDAASGTFHRIARRRAYLPGPISGSTGNHGYIELSIGGFKILAHRLAWAAHHNEEPTIVDHINGIKTDNRIVNLRLATPAQSSANTGRRKDNASGFKGVTALNGRWRARIQSGGKLHHIGMYDTASEAHAAYLERAHQVFGEFARRD